MPMTCQQAGGLLAGRSSRRLDAPGEWASLSPMGKIVDYLLHVIDLPIEKVIDYFPDVDKEEIMSTATQIEQKGIEKGIEKGKIEGKLAAARAMLEKGYPLTDVLEIADLTEEQLRQAGLVK